MRFWPGVCAALPRPRGPVLSWGKMLRLAVRACKGDEEGHNLVFMSYADFCALAGEGHQESVRVVLQVRICIPPCARPRTSADWQSALATEPLCGGARSALSIVGC